MFINRMGFWLKNVSAADSPHTNATYSIILFLKCLYPIITSTTILSMIHASVQIVCYSCHVEADSIKITGVVGDTSRFANM